MDIDFEGGARLELSGMSLIIVACKDNQPKDGPLDSIQPPQNPTKSIIPLDPIKPP